jgi:flagellar biosynthesis/type III secretory pathway protein FliH
MSESTFSMAFVLAVLKENDVEISLSNAYKIGNALIDVHDSEVTSAVRQSYANGSNAGKELGKAEGYNKGYAAGKMDSDEYVRGYNNGRADNQDEINHLSKIEENMKSLAIVAAEKIVEAFPNQKIKCIKLLREKSGLSLADCKDIIDATFEVVRGY